MAVSPGIPVCRSCATSKAAPSTPSTSGRPHRPVEQPPLDNALLSPDGGTLATAERSGSGYRFQLRDTRDGHLLRTLPSPPLPASLDPAEPAVELDTQDTMSLMAFSPDSRAFTYSVSAPGREASPSGLSSGT